MTEPPYLDEAEVSEHRSTTWAHSAEGDGCSSPNRHRDEHCWLHSRVEELERQLRLQTVVLIGALALSALLGSFAVSSFYKSERPTVVAAAALSLDTPSKSPSVKWPVEQPSQFERSQAWELGEERIEAIAVLHFDAQRMQAPTEQLATTWRDAGESGGVKLEGSAKRKVRGELNGAAARNCSPLSPETAVSAPFNRRGSGAGRPDERSHYAATDYVNLRAAPSNSAEVLTVVAQGDLVRRTGRDLGWLQVEYSDRSTSSIKGWVYSGHLRRVDP